MRSVERRGERHLKSHCDRAVHLCSCGLGAYPASGPSPSRSRVTRVCPAAVLVHPRPRCLTRCRTVPVLGDLRRRPLRWCAVDRSIAHFVRSGTWQSLCRAARGSAPRCFPLGTRCRASHLCPAAGSDRQRDAMFMALRRQCSEDSGALRGFVRLAAECEPGPGVAQ